MPLEEIQQKLKQQRLAQKISQAAKPPKIKSKKLVVGKVALIDLLIEKGKESHCSDYQWVAKALEGRDHNKSFQGKRLKDGLDLLLQYCEVYSK